MGADLQDGRAKESTEINLRIFPARGIKTLFTKSAFNQFVTICSHQARDPRWLRGEG
jgi:hypothetical protein